LGAVTCAAVVADLQAEPRQSARWSLVAATASGGALLALLPLLVDAKLSPVWVGALVTIWVAASLGDVIARPWLVLVLASTLTGLLIWSGALFLHQVLHQGLQGSGAAWWLAVPLTLSPPIACALLARRQSAFAPLELREGAMVLVGMLGLLVAALPSMIAGWRSATVLNAGGLDGGLGSTGVAPPLWSIAVLLLAASAGGLHAAWRRR
jgi:hypothetical protein